MSDTIHDDNNEPGTGKSTAKAAGGTGGIRLPPNKLKEVMKNWQALDVNEAAARVAEFFNEGVARASAHAVVSWNNVKDQGHAVITQFFKWGQEKGLEISYLMRNLNRENAELLRSRYGLNVTGLG